MVDAVVSYLTGNQSVTSTVPAISEQLARLAGIQEKIRTFDEVQFSIAKVSVANKAQARSEAEKVSSAVAGKLYNFGKKTGNNDLTERFNLTISDFRNYRDVDLVSRLAAMKEIVNANFSELGTYGIDQEKLQSFNTTVDQYIGSVGNREISYAEKKAARRSISQLFVEAGETLQALDKLVEEYRDSHSNFFNGYKSARGIRDLGNRKKAVPESPENNTQQ